MTIERKRENGPSSLRGWADVSDLVRNGLLAIGLLGSALGPSACGRTDVVFSSSAGADDFDDGASGDVHSNADDQNSATDPDDSQGGTSQGMNSTHGPSDGDSGQGCVGDDEDCDHDGFSINQGDCLDSDSGVRPFWPGVEIITEDLQVCPGVYPTQVIVEGQENLTLKAYDEDDPPILDMEGVYIPYDNEDVPLDSAIHVWHSDNIRVENFIVENYGDNMAAVDVRFGDGVQISGVKVRGAFNTTSSTYDARTHGIFAAETNHVDIWHCQVEDMAGVGIDVRRAEDIEVFDNAVTANGYEPNYTRVTLNVEDNRGLLSMRENHLKGGAIKLIHPQCDLGDPDGGCRIIGNHIEDSGWGLLLLPEEIGSIQISDNHINDSEVALALFDAGETEIIIDNNNFASNDLCYASLPGEAVWSNNQGCREDCVPNLPCESTM